MVPGQSVNWEKLSSMLNLPHTTKKIKIEDDLKKLCKSETPNRLKNLQINVYIILK